MIWLRLIAADQFFVDAVQHASRDDIGRAAAAAGMRSLWDDGLEKVASGLTSIEELARVLS
jgi:type II secretory ATPase GspE/PulE/Tfp pilus assembly ATPase PilB-like protein